MELVEEGVQSGPKQVMQVRQATAAERAQLKSQDMQHHEIGQQHLYQEEDEAEEQEQLKEVEKDQ